jgi:hypothetical protein
MYSLKLYKDERVIDQWDLNALEAEAIDEATIVEAIRVWLQRNNELNVESPDNYDDLYRQRGAVEAFQIAADDARKLRAQLSATVAAIGRGVSR